MGPYKRNFGSWNKFLISIGVTPIIKPPQLNDQKLRENWLAVKARLGRVPTIRDLNDKSTSLYNYGNYINHHGNLKNAANAMGDEPNYIHIKSRLVDEQSLRENWLAVKTRLGRVSTTRDLNDRNLSLYSTNNYKYYYKTYANAANAMGDEPNYLPESRQIRMEKKEMTCEIKQTKKCCNCYEAGFEVMTRGTRNDK